MRDVAHSALRALHLDYAITSISVGASHNYEVVMWDKHRNNYLSIRTRWETGFSREQMTAAVVQQLARRLAEWRAWRGGRFGERRRARMARARLRAEGTTNETLRLGATFP